jgi:hypothetical protein
LKAVAKVMAAIVVFLVVSKFLGPLQRVYPGVIGFAETYTAVYAAFMAAGELTEGTICHYGLNMGKAFFFISYSVYALNRGIITESIKTVIFTVNLQIFLFAIIFVNILDFSKSFLQIINHVTEKIETEETVLLPTEQEIPTR